MLQDDQIIKETNYMLLKAMGKISLVIMLVAMVTFFLLVSYFSGTAEGYLETLSNSMQTQDSITYIVLIYACVCIAGITSTVWLICLYSSFRMAGPLWRLQNQLISTEKRSGEGPIWQNLRRDDHPLLHQIFEDVKQALIKNKDEQRIISEHLRCYQDFLSTHNTLEARYELDRLSIRLEQIKTD